VKGDDFRRVKLWFYDQCVWFRILRAGPLPVSLADRCHPGSTIVQANLTTALVRQ
jgi:hypothetical protein